MLVIFRFKHLHTYFRHTIIFVTHARTPIHTHSISQHSTSRSGVCVWAWSSLSFKRSFIFTVDLPYMCSPPPSVHKACRKAFNHQKKNHEEEKKCSAFAVSAVTEAATATSESQTSNTSGHVTDTSGICKQNLQCLCSTRRVRLLSFAGNRITKIYHVDLDSG